MWVLATHVCNFAKSRHADREHSSRPTMMWPTLGISAARRRVFPPSGLASHVTFVYMNLECIAHVGIFCAATFPPLPQTTGGAP
mmetsp:Transcript_83126/g.269109  ORF Transcript_83126/g.269109 Transcript_83126/m.269109 type:complete len:84 (-) Transcript_83126:113-364(-)